MSSSSQPIPPHRFAEAIKELPLSNLHSKAAEIRNSISHLEASNEQLNSYADDGDRDCAEAIQENVSVIQRMEERIRLLKVEVEGRGFKWGEDDESFDGGTMTNGLGHNERSETNAQVSGGTQQGTGGGGSLGDEELARGLREQMEEHDDEEEMEEGVHL